MQQLSEDGRKAEGDPVAWLSTQNRYRDVVVAPDGRTIFIATDAFGSAAQKFGDGLNTSVLHNPGAILMFTYGESGDGLSFAQGTTTLEETIAGGGSVDGSQEWEDPASGGNGRPDGADAEAETGGADASVTEEANIADVSALGAPKYAGNCAACHGPAGQGGSGAVLAGNERLTEEDFVAIAIVHGFGYMPAFGDRLSDNDIAEISTYIRNNWGNEFGVLTTEQVSSVR